MSNIIITEGELKNLAYGDFKAKFEELGISSAYKHGKKKEDYIKTILDLLSAKKELAKPAIEIETSEAEALVETIKVKKVETRATAAQTKFDEALKVVLSKKEHWTKETMLKRIGSYRQAWLAFRGKENGNIAEFNMNVLQAAYDTLYA